MMPVRDRSPLLEIAIAVGLALIVLFVSPGVAISAIVALVALVLCGLATLVVRRREGPLSRRQLRRAAAGRGRRRSAGRGRRSGARSASSARRAGSSRQASGSSRQASGARRSSRRTMPPRPPRDWEQ
jgi:hypothetical protein